MRKILAVIIASLLVACGGPPRPTGPAPIRGRAVIPATWTLRSHPVTAPHAMVVSAHPLATQAGVEILKQGGTAIDKSEIGHLASGVPGSVAGMYEAWKKYGHLPWATLIAPAIRLAQGHVIDSARSRDIRSDREL